MSRAAKPPVKEDIRALTGAERTAVLMLALGEEHGARVWQMMDEDEIKEIFLQVAVYAGVPAGIDSFRNAKEAFKEMENG